MNAYLTDKIKNVHFLCEGKYQAMQVSVVVPVYNEEKYLSDCINSILGQTYSNIELILVDDGSTDRSGTICNQFQLKDERVKVFHKQNGGLVSAWKYGVNKAKNEYICFVDSDDMIQKNHIRDMVNAVQKYNADMVISPVNKIEGKKIEPFIYTLKPGYIKNYRNQFILKILTDMDKVSERKLPPNRWGKLLRKKDIINNLKYVDNRVTYGEDLNIIFPIFCDINSIYIINTDNNSYLYRLREGTMVSGYDKKRWLSISLVYSNLKKAVLNKSNLPLDMLKQVKIDYLKALIDCYKNQVQSSNIEYKDIKLLIKEMNNLVIFDNIKSIKLKGLSYKNYLIIWNIFHGNKVTNYFLFKLIEIVYKVKNKRK